MSEPGEIIEGKWQLVRAEMNGESAPAEVVERTTLHLHDGGYAVHFAGRVVDRGTFECGGVVSQTTLLLRGVAGPNAGRTIPCLYQIRGDRLRVCFGFGGVAPTDFTADEASGRYLATYRREANAG